MPGRKGNLALSLAFSHRDRTIAKDIRLTRRFVSCVFITSKEPEVRVRAMMHHEKKAELQRELTAGSTPL
jgi:hypothetical protein